MADAFPIAEGELEINADPNEAWRRVQEFLRRVDQRLRASEDESERSGRRSGTRFGEAFSDSLRRFGSNVINAILPNGGPTGGGEGGGGGGGGGFIQGLLGNLSGGFRRILDEIRSLIEDIETALGGLGGGGGGFLSDLRDSLTDIWENIRTRFVSLMTFLHATWTRLLGALGGIPVSSLWTRFLTWIRTVWTRFSTWASSSFSALWTRIRSFGTSMLAAARVIWTRFSTWAVATFSTLSTLASAFWARFRTWAMTTLTTIALVAGILFSRLRTWGSAMWTRIRSWGVAAWASISARARAMWTRFTTWARTAWTSISTWFSSLFTTISGWLSTLSTQLSSFFSSIGPAVGPVLQATAYASLIPIILSLGGAIANLLPLLLLLPAAIGTLVSILAPAIVGFKGLGEAIGAGLSGDVEKLNEALKKLTPNARAFVKEFIKLGPVLKDIKRRTQDALFKPLLGTVAPLAKTFFPALAAGMEKVAGALGRLLAGFARMLGTPEVISAINALFASSARILDKLGPAFANLFGALFGTVEGGLPWIERLTDMLANAINTFANWLRMIKGNGDMQRWLETAWSTAKDVWEVLKQLGLLVKNIFADSGDEGQDFLKGLADSLKDINAWLTSREGKDFLDVLASSVVAVVWAFKALAWVVWFTAEAFLGLKDGGIAVWHWLEDIWAWLVKAYHAVADWLSMAAGVSWDWLKNAASAVGDFFVGVGHWFADAYNFIVVWLGRIMDWFGQIPGWIGQFFSNLPGWIAAGLAALRDAIFYSIGYVAGLIVQTFMGLPGFFSQVWTWIKDGTVAAGQAIWGEVSTWPGKAWNAISSLGSTLLGYVDSVWDSLWESSSKGVQKTTDTVAQLPAKASNAVSSMPGAVSRWVSDTWSKAVDGTSRGVTSVVDTVRGLGSKVVSALSGAGGWLVDAGRNMMRGLVNGIGDLLGWAVNQARAAARAVADGFLDALGVKSPSRVMRVEVGRYILPGVVEGIKDTIPDTQRYLGAMANMMVQGFQPTVSVAAPQVNMGTTVLHADFGDGIEQAVPLIISRNPRIVAGAAAVGNRERSGWVNTSRGTVVG